jgi:ABC-type multidrug transport system fused ATPase/permease subunit
MAPGDPPHGAPSDHLIPAGGGRRGLYPADDMSSQYIFTMYKLSRSHPPDKQVLKDVSLSFMPGAKIGVLGLNGSGK